MPNLGRFHCEAPQIIRISLSLAVETDSCLLVIFELPLGQ